MALQISELKNRYYTAGWLLIISFIFYVVILALGSLEGAPKSRADGPFFPYLSDKPLTEDGYYMLTVAWNIAAGKGFTYNLGIRTTGVQPLAALVYSFPAFIVQNFGGNKYDFARAVIILSALLQVIYALLIYWVSISISSNPHKPLYFLISVCVVLLNFKVLLNFAIGLETGLYLILLALFFLYCLKYKQIQPGIKHLLALGLISGLLLLCRLDSAIILFTFYVLLLLTQRIRFRQLVMITIIAVLIYLPWQIYVLEITGNILQSSARSQIAFLGYYDMNYIIEQFFTSIIHTLTPFLYTGNILLWLMFPLGIPYIILMLMVYRKYKSTIIDNQALSLLQLISSSFLVLSIVFFFFSDAPYFYFRYLAYIMVVSLPVIVILFTELLKKQRAQFIIICLIVLLFAFSIQSYLYFHSGKSALAITMRQTYVLENFSGDVRIGAFQTGALGYYVDNVINLDGKMNDNALDSYKSKSLEKYIDSIKIEVLIDWKEIFIEMLDRQYLEENWRIYSEDIVDGRTICYVRKKFIY